ncbi:MAG: Mur ligase family protein [Simkaniaceae bacterium]|nr:Mur ligase family protein [Candidatus Sacchlamyda saccharinae]
MLLKTEYEELLEELFKRKPKTRENNREEMLSSLQKYGNPHESFPMVHVAGTNGKGQVSIKMARALEAVGLNVGLYTSPHLYEYRERITVNGQKIPEETVVRYFKELEGEPHFFNCTTIFALRYFQEENVDVAILETGLGGSLDATNVVTPILSVITSVSYDHMEYLGQSLNSIAEQKAGIIKPKVPVVVGPNAKFLPIFEKAENVSSPVHIIEKKSCFYDTENQLIAKEALELLKPQFSLSDKHIEEGLKCSLPCRFEKRKNVIYDVAHNPDGFAKLASALEHHYPHRKFRFVIGMSKRKDIEACLKEIERKAQFAHFVMAKESDAASPEELAKEFQNVSSCPFTIEDSVESGFQKAKLAAGKKEIVVVCGSFYIMQATKPA